MSLKGRYFGETAKWRTKMKSATRFKKLMDQGDRETTRRSLQGAPLEFRIMAEEMMSGGPK